MHRRTGGWLLLTLALVACATSPDVTSTEARANHDSSVTTVYVPGSGPTTDSSTPPTTASTTPTSNPAGSDPNGIGDALFPALGNPGIDVEHYTLVLDYDPKRRALSATEHIDLVMTQDRDMFSLDSDGPSVSAVSIDGANVKFVAAPPELLITPAGRLVKGRHIGVDITYTVSPESVPSAAHERVGWFPTPGGSYVLNEPEGGRTWLPSDDHPSDRATFRFEITVPTGLTAVANGALIDHTSTASTDTWIWQEDRPMATYLIQVLTGDYELVDGVGPNGLPLLSAVLHQDRATMQPALDTIGEQIDFFDDYFGPFPFDRYGIAIADSAPGIAMETMERSMFSRLDFTSGRLDLPQELLLSHELTHQWFGDAVSPARWTDVWLNESFATYGEWMWLDHLGLRSIEESADAGLTTREPGSTASPSVDQMFGFNSYDGGAVILHALRKTIGDNLFFTLLRRWVADNSGTSRTTQDFVALANEVAGRDLTQFFATWLYADTVPTSFPV
ncbi:MAG TPA: M1 family metallopeptidase [Ilumatobacteraceae bacterium]|nr:M1 family metallopeptidase [Ilumatobacteraceae bacterium]